MQTRSSSTEPMLSAAIQVLTESTQPLTCHEMIQRMAITGIGWSPRDRTHEHSLYAALVRLMAKQGVFCPIRKTGEGRFLLLPKRVIHR